MTQEVVCKDCGTVFPENRSRKILVILGVGCALGLIAYNHQFNALPETFSWMLLGGLGLGTLTAIGKARSKCPACGSEACVPANTPLGHEVVSKSRKATNEMDSDQISEAPALLTRKLTKREIVSCIVLIPVVLGGVQYYERYSHTPVAKVPTAADGVHVGSAVMEDGPYGQRLLDISVFNQSVRPVKDIEIKCDLVSQTAAVVDHYTKVFYERLAAGDTMTATEIKMGLVSNDAKKAFCKVTNARFDG
jgi:hypothetical protein